MEQRFQNRLEIPFGHRLCDSIRDSGNSQRPRFSFALADVHPTHWQRHIAARRHPIPESIEIVFQVPVELFDRLIIDACRAPICLDSLVCLPHFALCNTKRLCFIHAGPPFAGCPRNKAEQRRPFGPVPLQNLRPYYERLRPCAPPRYSGSRGCCPLELLPLHRSDRFLRSLPQPDSDSRHLHAGRRLGNKQVAPQPCPGAQAPDSGFGAISARYGTSSVVHLRSSSRISPDGFQSAFSHNAHDGDS